MVEYKFNRDNRFVKAWNVFMGRDRTYKNQTIFNKEYVYAPSYINPMRPLANIATERNLVTSLYNQISIDVASIPIRHIRVDETRHYINEIDSDLNNCLALDANLDQTGRQFIQECVLSLFDEGCIAIVAVDTSVEPNDSGAYDVRSIRTGRIITWYPHYVEVEVYNENSGQRENIYIPKTQVAIVENPLYEVINKPNSTIKRLIDKLNLIDNIDRYVGSGKIDLIIQLPYVIKTEERKRQAEIRRKSIEDQLQNGAYGIAYTDGTERITQLNRPAENNLLEQIKYLTSELYNRLGLTEDVFRGTADEKAMLNYYNRTVEPILAAISDSMCRTFLTKTARTQGQRITYIRDPFKMVPMSQFGMLANTFVQQEILSSNEIRALIGYPPSSEPQAEMLRNSNINPLTDEEVSGASQGDLDTLDDYDSELDDLEKKIRA